MQRQTAPLEVLAFQPDTCHLEPVASLSEHYPALALDSGYRVCAIGRASVLVRFLSAQRVMLVFDFGSFVSCSGSGVWLWGVHSQ